MEANSSNQNQINITKFHIDTLFKFIDTYDGNRDNLSSWLTSCDRALQFATNEQKPILFAFIQNRLTDKAQSTCANTIFNNWTDLKEFLKSRFGNRKHQTYY